MQETWVRSLGQEDPLEKGMATHSSILAWRITWTEEPGGLRSMGSQRLGHDWATEHYRHKTFTSLVFNHEDGKVVQHLLHETVNVDCSHHTTNCLLCLRIRWYIPLAVNSKERTNILSTRWELCDSWHSPFCPGCQEVPSLISCLSQ